MFIKKIFVLLILFVGVLFAQVNVDIPTDNSGDADATINVPINVGDLTGLGVLAYQLTVTYDPAVVEAVGIETTGTMSATSGWTALPNTGTSGEIVIGGFGASELIGSGVLVYMQFHLIGSQGTSSALTFTQMLFNSGTPAVNTTDGTITINTSGGSIVNVDIPTDNSGDADATINVPINVGDLTGLGVLAYQLTVAYDPAVVEAVGIETTGTLSATSGWTALPNTGTSGEIVIGGFGASELIGSGVLVYMQFHLIGSQGTSSALTFTQMLFNSGTPTVNTTDGTIMINYSLPSVPILITPTNNSTGNILPINLAWNSSDLAVSYKLQVSTTTDFATTVLDTTGLIDTTFTLSALSNLTTYYWRVKAVNVGGESNWSETWNFKTLGEPTTVTTLYPSSDATNIPIDLTFVWSKAEDQLRPEIGGTALFKKKGSKKGEGITSVGSYWFELTKDISSTSEIIDSTITDTTRQVTGLNNLTEYWWRVRAKNEAGWGNYTSWSKFTTVVDTPAVVQLTLPTNNSTGNILPLNLVWNSSNWAASYKLQVSTESGFAATVLDTSGITDTTFTLSALSNLTTYYWRVKAVNVGGESAWSETWNFKTLGEPTIVTLLSPVDNAINQPIEIQFMWRKAEDQFVIIQPEQSGNNVLHIKHLTKGNYKKGNVIASVNNYRLQITKDVTSTDYIVDDNSITDTTKQVSGLENATEYFWRVAAKNETGWNSFSDWFSFITIVDLPGIVTLISPVDSLEYDSTMTQPEFLWHSDPIAANYTLQLSYQSNFDNTFFAVDSLIDTLFISEAEFEGDFYWRVQCYNVAGSGEWSAPNFVHLIIVGVEDFNEIPKSYSLSYNYPNPFNPSTVIEYSLPQSSFVQLEIYDVVGNRVGELVNKSQTAGNYQITFDASNLSSGVYFYRISANSGTSNFSSVKKMILLR